MAIKRFFATKDNTITNAFKDGLTTRGTGSNMGAADIMEVFSIYGQTTSTSSELSRALVEFDIAALSASRDNGNIPASISSVFGTKHDVGCSFISTTGLDYRLFRCCVRR